MHSYAHKHTRKVTILYIITEEEPLYFPFVGGGCGDPGVPENGNKVGISYGVTSEVFFTCSVGYTRIGSEMRTCLSNSTWSGTQPICKSK